MTKASRMVTTPTSRIGAMVSARYPRTSRSPSRYRRRHLLFENLERRDLLSATSQDFLYIGDANTDSVQKFNADTGALIGSFVAGGNAVLHGPRGLVVDQGNLLVVNQNVETTLNGEVLRYDGTTGSQLSPSVSADNPHAPFAPRGIVVKDNVLYVADAEGSTSWGSSFPPIAKYDATTGVFIGDLVPNACFTSELHPRGLVFGPDGYLYATFFSPAEFASSDPPGHVLRFLDTTTGAFEIVAANYGDKVPLAGGTADLHNPEGIVFGPDGRLYVTSFRPDSLDNGIVVLDVGTKSQVSFVPLGQYFAQALLFGPGENLYVPITGGGADAGSVRAYDLAAGNYRLLIAPIDGGLQQPWYLTFGQTNPATLAYQPLYHPESVNLVEPVADKTLPSAQGAEAEFSEADYWLPLPGATT